MTGVYLKKAGSVQSRVNNHDYNQAVVVAQMSERSLPMPEDPGSNPAIGKFY